MYQLPRKFTYDEGRLTYKGHDIFALAKKYDTPLRVNDPSRLVENLDFLKQLVQDELSTRDLSHDRFMCGYAIKANQHHDLVQLAAQHADFLEASSENDLIALEHLKADIKEKMIVCHGFKTPGSTYLQKILESMDRGLTIIPVINSVDELRAFHAIGRKMRIGLRIASESDHQGQRIYDRFGITTTEVRENMDLFTDTEQLKLEMVHIHVSNTIKDAEQRIEEMKDLFTLYDQLTQSCHTLRYVNCGGGLPDRSRADETFYREFYNTILDALQQHNGNNIPTIMTEAGRFLVQEAQFLVLQVIETKQNNPNFTWFILNGSAINLIPETMLDPSMKFQILPAKAYETERVKAICAGITCDPEDYFHHTILEFPSPPSDENMYVVIPNTGAYQESLLGSARGAHGHCLVQAPKELTLDGETVREARNNPHFLADLRYIDTE